MQIPVQQWHALQAFFAELVHTAGRGPVAGVGRVITADLDALGVRASGISLLPEDLRISPEEKITLLALLH